MRRTPALIVGGGPAGASAAITLASGGMPHLLIERTVETADALCGGFLSWRTLDALARLGVEADALNPMPIRRMRVFAGGRAVESGLPAPARAVSRRRLDRLLLDRAIASGAAVERGVAVRAIGDVAHIADGADVAFDTLFLASGKHDVRGAARPAAARGRDPAIGLRVRLPAASPLARMLGDAVELHLFDGGYAGFVLQEDGSANLCLAVRRSRLAAAGDLEALLRAIGHGALGDRLAWRAGGAVDAVANVPYGWRAAPSPWFRLGDQAGVISSLAGEGMGIAIASGISAARAYRAGDEPRVWQAKFAGRLRAPIGTATLVRGIAERPRASRILLPALAYLPGMMQVIARLTRISQDDA